MPSLYGYKLGYKVLWLKPDKHYVTRKGSRLTSVQSYITGLYSVRCSPLHIINSWYEAIGTINPFKQPKCALELKLSNFKNFVKLQVFRLPVCLPA